MNPLPASPSTISSWQDEICAREEESRRAFLQADLPSLDQIWTDGFAVNSPLQRVLEKQPLLEALRTGRIRHLAYDFDIEFMQRHGDSVVVMGRDRVVDPPDRMLSHRRFTNIWQHDGTV